MADPHNISRSEASPSQEAASALARWSLPKPIQDFLNGLVEPLPELVALEERHRARAVAAVLLVGAVLSMLLAIAEMGSPPLLFARLFTVPILMIGYILSRTKRYRTGASISLITLLIAPLLPLMLGVRNIDLWEAFTIRALGAAVLLAYLIISWRVIAAFSAVALLEILVIAPRALPNFSPTIIATELFFSCVALFYVLVIAREYHLVDRLWAQEAIQASEARYRAIVEDQNELICRWLPETRSLTFVNGAYRRYFGGSRSELIGTDFINDVYPDDALIVENAIAQIAPDNSIIIYEHRIKGSGGGIRWMQWTDRGIFDQTGKLIEVQSVGRDITESREAQDRLRESEARYRAIVEDQNELICRWLPDRTLTFVNHAYCRFAMLTYEELIGTSVMALIYPDDLVFIQRMVDGLSLANPTVSYEHRIAQPDGSLRWLEWTDRAIFDEKGVIVEYQSVGRDITELKQAEEAEREQRTFAEILRANAAVISSTLDLDEVLDRILQHTALAYPFVSADIMLTENGVARVMRSTGARDLDYNMSIQSLRLLVSEFPNMKFMTQTGQPIVVPDTRHSTMWVDLPISGWIRSSMAAPIRLEGETIGFLILNSDKPNTFNEKQAVQLRAFADQAATAIRNARLFDAERRHAEEMESQVQARTAELELATRRLSVIFDSTGEGIFYTEDEVIQYVNPAFCKMVGSMPDQLIGQRMTNLYSHRNSAETLSRFQHYTEIIRDIGIWRGEILMRRPDDSEFDAGLTISPIGSIDDAPVRAVTIVRDISQEKALEAQRSNLLAFASHELRTPITNLKTRLYLLRRKPESLLEHIGVLDAVVQRMQYLVENLLDTSRLERGMVRIDCKPLDVRDMIQEIILVQRPEAEQHGLTLLAELPAEPLMIDADRQRMTQVLTNLINNAINYTPEAGTITVGAKRTGEVALLFVSDTGIGIAPEHLQHIFEPFFRVASKVEGTGLGLSIVKEIVYLHKGEISVQSEVGKGSRFIIRLPLYTQPEVIAEKIP